MWRRVRERCRALIADGKPPTIWKVTEKDPRGATKGSERKAVLVE